MKLLTSLRGMCNAKLMNSNVECRCVNQDFGNLHLLQSLAIKLPQTNPPIGSCHRKANRVGTTKPKPKARGTVILIRYFVETPACTPLTVVLVLKTNN
jgi:hypothetical protein